MTAQQAARQAAEKVQQLMAEATGDEEEVLQAFADEISGIVAGWDMRLEELSDDEEAY